MSDGAVAKDGSFNHDNTVPPKSDRVMPLFSLKGKTAIISGAGAGIGTRSLIMIISSSNRFEVSLSRKATPKLVRTSPSGTTVTRKHLNVLRRLRRRMVSSVCHFSPCQATLLTRSSGKAYQVDVTDEDAVEKAVEASVKDLGGRLDVFVANSGIPWTQGPALDGERSHYHKVVSTDLDGTFFCARAAGKIWRKQKFEGTDINGNKLENFTYGSFIATASMSGHIVNFPQLQAAYNAAKSAVIHLCRCLAVEWVKFARANSISPGYINTEISDFVPPETKAIWKGKTPMGREGEANELKGGFLYLASSASSFTTGADIVIDVSSPHSHTGNMLTSSREDTACHEQRP